MPSATRRGLEQHPEPQRRRRHPRPHRPSPGRSAPGRSRDLRLAGAGDLAHRRSACGRDGAPRARPCPAVPRPASSDIGHQHRVVIGRDGAAPLAPSPARSNFRFWPILRTRGVLEQRLQPRRRACERASGPAAGRRRTDPPCRGAGAGHSRRGPARSASEKPTSSACSGSSEVVSVSKATTPCLARLGDPVVEPLERATPSRRPRGRTAIGRERARATCSTAGRRRAAAPVGRGRRGVGDAVRSRP